MAQKPGKIDTAHAAAFASALAPWQHDGALVREASHAEVYVLFGNARFHIGSPDELTALGYSWSQVTVVPDGSTGGLNRVPDRGTIVRDRTAPEVWASLGDHLYWVTSADAMRFLKIDWSRVHVVPAGSLAGLPMIRPSSASATPASVVFPPNTPHRWPRGDLPGYTLPNGARITELRGWINVGDGIANPVDPDFHLQLEVDPAWLDAIGANWHTVFKVGDMLQMGTRPLVANPDAQRTDHTAWAATPTIHIEVNGWDLTYKQGAPSHPERHNGTMAAGGYPAYTSGVKPPSDWSVNSSNGGQLAQTVWPYLPLNDGGKPASPALRTGQYVRVVGSVISDIPHMSGQHEGVAEWLYHTFGVRLQNEEQNRACQDWAGTDPEYAESCRPRWTEIHPADLLEVVPSGPSADSRREAVYGVTVVARSALTDTAVKRREFNVLLPAPTPRPPRSKVKVVEYVTPDTNYSSIVIGNASLNGATISTSLQGAQVHVEVVGEPFDGPSGRFAAVYRVSWEPDPNPALTVTQSPASVPHGVPATVTFNCLEAGTTGPPIDATVSMDGTVIGHTNQPVTATFVTHKSREWIGPEPGDHSDPTSPKPIGHWITINVPPVVEIAATGYASTALQVRLS